MIAQWFPGVGDPWSLTMDQFNGLLSRVPDVRETVQGRAPGVEGHRQRIERAKRRRETDG